MSQNPLLSFLGASAALCALGHAGVLSWSGTAPVVDGADIANFVGASADADNVNGGNDAGCFIAANRPALGQTFTTGSDPGGYILNSVTLQHVQYDTDTSGFSVDAGWGNDFELRVGTKNGTTSFTALVTENVPTVVTGNATLDTPGFSNGTGTGWYATYTLDNPLSLAPNTTYGFTVYSPGPYYQTNGNGTTSDNYTGGEAFGVEGATVFDYPGDHVFHLDIDVASNLDDDMLPDNWELGWAAITELDQLDGTITSPVGSGDGSGDWDGDGLTDFEEFDNGANPTEGDIDGDTLLDGEEVKVHGTNPNEADSDFDGLDDLEEVTEGADGFITNPIEDDTDGDNLLDGWESEYMLDPTDNGDTDPDFGEFGDPDEDFLDNFGEQAAGTDPNDPDTDGDGLLDGDEYSLYFSNPLLTDSDFDGLSDMEEVELGEDGYITDPIFADTDGDGVPDGSEVANGTDPEDELDFPTDLGNYIASVTPTNPEPEGVTGTHVTGVFFGEDVPAFSDRLHQWNGLTVDGLPTELVGGDYIVNANDSRGIADFSEDVTLKAPATLYLLWDDRVELAPWCTDGAGLDFVDTGLDVGWDEEGAAPLPLSAGPGESINQTASVYIAQDTANGDTTTLAVGTYSFFERGGGGSSMYGVVATAPAGVVVSGPVTVLSAGFNGAAFEVTYEGLDTATSYQWQRSAPGLGSFTNLGAPVVPVTSSETFSDPAPPEGAAYYRLSFPD